MKSIGMTWRVQHEHWEEYKTMHLNPWPELIATFQQHGIHHYSLFAFGHRVFAYMEVDGEDIDAARRAVAETDIKRRWDAEVTIWVEPEAEDGSGMRFMQLERIFYCP
jgi:L-rhamnose mutarotase